jgi:hypothetical protein
MMKKIMKRMKFLLWLFKIKKSIDPPILVKEKIIRFYGKTSKIKTLIETGTYKGEMIFALKEDFEKIFSIELDKTLATNAKKMFSEDEKIKIIWGDSEKELPKILKKISSHCLFWLDAHYDGGRTARGKRETPILEELKAIMKHSKKDIILINNANNFGEGNYPAYEEIKAIIKGDFNMQTKNNIIRIYPKNLNK